MTEIKRISKPGLRVYKGTNALPYVLSGVGMALISTPKGVMTDKAARKAKLGGEVMAYIW
jgi:small subunit ribosomal protein S8